MTSQNTELNSANLHLNSRPQTTTDLAGKYLTFQIGSERFGVGILKVIEINSMMRITKVPRTANHIKGVVNLRGRIIPVTDLRLLFGMEEQEYDEQTCTIIVNLRIGDSNVPTGMIVDRVLEVADYTPKDISPSPNYGLRSEDNDFVIGMSTRDNAGVVMLIDIDKVLTIEEAHSLQDFITNQNKEEQKAGL